MTTLSELALLSEALQLQIIDQAGATYRNVYLAHINKSEAAISEKALHQAEKVTNKFVELMASKLKNK